MAVRPIIGPNNPVLRRKARAVDDPNTAQTQELIEAGKLPDAIIAAITANTEVEFVTGKEIEQLSQYRSSSISTLGTGRSTECQCVPGVC